MMNPGIIHAEKFWQTVLFYFSDTEQLEALAILPLVLMAQI
jgi:predicted metal-dependent hydrolase